MKIKKLALPTVAFGLAFVAALAYPKDNVSSIDVSYSMTMGPYAKCTKVGVCIPGGIITCTDDSGRILHEIHKSGSCPITALGTFLPD